MKNVWLKATCEKCVAQGYVGKMCGSRLREKNVWLKVTCGKCVAQGYMWKMCKVWNLECSCLFFTVSPF